MSGGSFNYLCHRSAVDIFHGDDLTRMAEQLESMGYAARAAAEATRRIVAKQDELDAAIADIAPVWRAIEWWQSCDFSQQEAWKAIGAWEKGR